MLRKQMVQRRLLAAAFRRNRAAFSEALFVAARDKTCASWSQPQGFEEVKEWGRSLLLTAIDLLTAWFETSDPVYSDLFMGWVHSRMVSSLSEEDVPADYKPGRAVELAKASWVASLNSQVSPEVIEVFVSDLDQIIECLSKPMIKSLRILFIGDCLQFEAITALAGPCVRAQIQIEPTLLNERVQPVLRNRIREFRRDAYDLVFFSPFSHSYLPQYEALLKPGSCFWPAAKISASLNTMLHEVSSTLETLTGQMDCPIYVHNTAGTIQSFTRISGLAKNLSSIYNRKRATTFINRGITECLKKPSLESRVRLLDEHELRKLHSGLALGQVYLNSHSLHPTCLGIELGRRVYFEAVYATAYLAGRKIVVCDLDNTLWQGVIGEGPVSHYFERQTILKGLRQRGILLAINSKNAPGNVQWSGALLQPDDFVASRINWNSKVENMASIRDELNLKLKNFIFIDDRPDELWRMKNSFPEVLTLDATQPETWGFLAHWHKHLPFDQDEDRTRLYHERRQREQFLSFQPESAVPSEEDETAALADLNLSVKIEEPGHAGLKRVAELINRTNQFNTCGSRTTVRELEERLDDGHWIITAKASDRFGSMGVVGAMVVDRKPGKIEIPIFVLSCRAFGFGIEYALLNSVKALVPDDFEVVGRYKETQVNQPSRQLYPASGMRCAGGNWIGRVGELPPDPVWLSVEREIGGTAIIAEHAAQASGREK